jgi:hypothetical protein
MGKLQKFSIPPTGGKYEAKNQFVIGEEGRREPVKV